MLLCDIGNTSFAFDKDGKVFKHLVCDFDIKSIKEDVYYICVNLKIQAQIIKNPKWHNIENLVNLNGAYDKLGIDRKLAISALKNGIVVDVGSAITVDVIENSIYQGGFIYPGFHALQKAFKGISDKIDYSLNFKIELNKLAKNVQDSISYGAFVPLINEIKYLSDDKYLVITGGDGALLSKHLKNSHYKPNWIFDAMKHLIKRLK